VWHVVRLIQLKFFNRWFSILFFGWWAQGLAWNSIDILQRPERTVRPILVLLSFALLSVASVWYLLRRSFREFAVRFVAEQEREKHSRMLQKISQKKIQRGL